MARRMRRRRWRASQLTVVPLAPKCAARRSTAPLTAACLPTGRTHEVQPRRQHRSRSQSRRGPASRRGVLQCASRLQTAATAAWPTSREPPSPQWMLQTPALSRAPLPAAPAQMPTSHELQPQAFLHHPTRRRSFVGGMTPQKREAQPARLRTAETAASPTSREPLQWVPRMPALSRAPSTAALAQMPMSPAAQLPRSHALQPAASRRHPTPHRSLVGGWTPQKRAVLPAVLQMAATTANPTSRAAQQACRRHGRRRWWQWSPKQQRREQRARRQQNDAAARTPRNPASWPQALLPPPNPPHR